PPRTRTTRIAPASAAGAAAVAGAGAASCPAPAGTDRGCVARRARRREPSQPERSVALAAAIDPAWPAIRYPDEGVTPAGLAELVSDMVDAGSREHYVDA